MRRAWSNLLIRGITQIEHERLEATSPYHPYCVWSRKYEVETADAWAAYYNARDARRAEYERRGLSRFRGTYRHTEALAYEILSIPAVTLAGVMVKVRLGEWFEEERADVQSAPFGGREND